MKTTDLNVRKLREHVIIKSGIPCLLMVLTAFSFSLDASAASSDKDQPVVINSKETEIDFRTGQRIWTGDVTVKQGTMRIWADKLVADYKNGVLQTAVATGRPAKFIQTPDGSDEDVVGIGNELTMDEIENVIILDKDASLKQGQQKITGCKITYDMINEKLKSESGGCKYDSTVTEVDQMDEIPEKKPSTESGRSKITIKPKNEGDGITPAE